MKILILILIILGGATTYLSKYIVEFLWKNQDDEEKEKYKIYVKLTGLVLVIIAAMIAFFS